MLHPYIYRAGLIAAGISVAYTLVSYLIGIEAFTSFWIPIVITIAIIVYLVLSLKKIKGFLDGKMTFTQGFVNFLGMSLIFVLISQVFYFFILHVIDPEFGVAVSDVVIEKAIGMMERFGTPENEIEKALIEMETDFEKQGTFGGALMGMLKYLGFLAVIGLISAAVLRTKDMETLETTE